MAEPIISQTRLSNRALILLGSVLRVSSLEDPSPVAQQLFDLWPESRRNAIGAHPFNFAIKRFLLNQSAEVPVFGYDSMYKLPAENIRWLPPASDDDFYFKGEEEGEYLLCNETGDLPVRCIVDIPDVSKWPAHFAEYFVHVLARDAAESITQIGGNVDDMTVKADAALTEAARRDGLSSGRRNVANPAVTSAWARARRGYFQPRAPGR